MPLFLMHMWLGFDAVIGETNREEARKSSQKRWVSRRDLKRGGFSPHDFGRSSQRKGMEPFKGA